MKRLWKIKGLGKILCLLLLVSMLFGCRSYVLESDPTDLSQGEISSGENHEVEPERLYEDSFYTSKEEVAAYINQFGHLPSNYIKKSEAKEHGWKSSEGNLDEVLPGMSIGGDKFGNREGILPEADGRKYYECDINYAGGHRGAERIVYSNDGLIYYTGDHYKTFELLYGEE